MIGLPDWLWPSTSPFTPLGKVEIGQGESVQCSCHRLEPVGDPESSGCLWPTDTGSRMLTSANATAQLMELADSGIGRRPSPPSPSRWEHRRRPDHRGRHQNIHLAARKAAADGVFSHQRTGARASARAASRQRAGAQSLASSPTGVTGGPASFCRRLSVTVLLSPSLSIRAATTWPAAAATFFGDSLPCASQPLRLVVDEYGVGGDRLTSPWKFAQCRCLRVTEDRQRYGSESVSRSRPGDAGLVAIGCFRHAVDPLLHAETVLFVHYHHAEAGGNSTASCNSAWVPMAMPPHLSRSRRATFALSRRHRTRQQCNPRSSILAAELAAIPKWAEDCRISTEHVGPQALPSAPAVAPVTGVDHLQHRQDRDDGLAGSGLRPCTNRFIGLVEASSSEITPSTSRCPVVSSNGNLVHHRLRESVGASQRRRSDSRPRHDAAEPMPTAGPTASSNVSRSWRVRWVWRFQHCECRVGRCPRRPGCADEPQLPDRIRDRIQTQREPD